jgi:ATP/ADP translocase
VVKDLAGVIDVNEGYGFFFFLFGYGIYPNEDCFAAVIRACSNADNISMGKMIFGFVIKSG